ncbi:MAG: DNA polymerase I [Thermodesulfovibrionales bacterium]|nr:DNA polymerase I [Thermodesulfovibrionales bacterium]
MNLYLIDGNSYVYRAFYAIRGLTDSKGRPTNAIYGFTNMLLKIMRERQPDGIVVSFDSPQPTERHLLFEEYKAHRPEAPDDLRRQIPHIRRVVDAFKIKMFVMPGYEADDILATLAEKASKHGMNVFIVTGDKDMLQLLNNSIKVYDPIKDVVLDEAHVMEKLGVPPGRVTEFMALVGDAADNIPGIKGIGEKTAKELLSEFGSLDEMTAHPERIKKERIRRLVAENIDIMRLSKRLAEINRDVPLDMDLEEFLRREPDWHALLSLFKEFEFSSLMRFIPGGPPAKRDYRTISEVEELKGLAGLIKEEFSFNAEATGKDPIRDKIVGVSVCSQKGKAAYMPLAHTYEGAPKQIKKKDALDVIGPLLEDKDIEKTGHDLKYDILLLRKEGINTCGRLYDTMVASYLLNPLRSDHSLENISLERLSRKKKTFIEVAGKGGFEEVRIPEASEYACDNAELAIELKELLFKSLREEGMEPVYFNIEMPLIYVLSEMQEAGMRIDAERLNDLSKELERELEGLKKRIYFLSGMEFNINSPKQLGKVLFESLGLKPGKRKKTGYSTEMGVLEELAKTHELPGEILNWRSLYKLKATYVDALPLLINPRTGRLHTSFNQTVTATGRLSSSEPNLQNIPVRGEWGRRIREAFTADEGNLIITADYSQVELRILAHLSGDKGLTEAFLSDIDIHSVTASEIFGISPDKVTSDMRRVAKTVNFGVVYGITPFGLSETLDISREEAGRYIKQYFQRHPLITAYIDRTVEEARARGYVMTISGRRRPVPELKSKNAGTRQLGERLAANSPIQGTAADIIKIAMINISRELKMLALRAKIILQVHDELVFECPENEKDRLMEIVKNEMEGVSSENGQCALRVPLKVEMGSGRNWAEAGH